MLLKIEKALFYLLAFCFFFQARFILWPEAFANEWQSVYLYATDILILALFFFWARRSSRLVKEFFEKGNLKRLIRPLIIFLLLSLASVFVAKNKILGVYGFLKLSEFAALFWYASQNFKKFLSFEKFWQFFVAGAALQSIVALGQFFSQRSLGLKYFESPLAPDLAGVAKIALGEKLIVRAYGLVPHPNILAAILILSLFGLGWLFVKKYRFWRPLEKGGYVFVLCLNFTALFFTFSRLVTVFGLLFFVVWLALNYRQSKREILTVAVLLLVVGTVLSVIFWPQVFSRYDPEVLARGQSVDLRMVYNRIAWETILFSPLLGVGQSNFVFDFSQIYSKLATWVFQPVHNVYLLVAAETGILGFLAFAWFLFSLAWQGLKRRLPSPDNCLICIFGFIITIGLFDHFWWDIQQGQIMFWLFLGILASFCARSSMDRAKASGALD